MSRALRAQRKGVVEQKRGETRPFRALNYIKTDEDLIEFAEEWAKFEPDDAPFQLLDGTPVSAAAPWQMPQQMKEK